MKMRGNVLAILCLTFLLGFCVPNAQTRMWTDKSGKYSIDAEFIGLTDGQVTLKCSDGKTVRLALENLSKADQEQVRQLTSSTPKAKTDSPIQSVRPATKTAVASAKPDSSKAKTFTEKEIRKALKDFEAVNGRCGQDTPEMVRLILGEAIPQHETLVTGKLGDLGIQPQHEIVEGADDRQLFVTGHGDCSRIGKCATKSRAATRRGKKEEG
jgi:hypothetical protein